MDGVQTEQPRLRAVAAGMPLLADLHRGDSLLYEPVAGGGLRVVAQARPHSVPPVYGMAMVGREQPATELPAVARIVAGQDAAQGPRQLQAHRSHIVQRAYAVQDAEGQLVGVLTLEKSLVEHERHATRRAAFRRALEDLRDMVLAGRTDGLAGLPPFLETDGILLVNARGKITYLSGLGSFLYRRLGYSEELIGKPLSRLDTPDVALVERAFEGQCAFADERNEGDQIWQRKVLPIVGPRFRLPDRLPPAIGLRGARGFGPRDQWAVLITVHDATAARRKAQERIVRQAMVQEIHHRVKNNLQTVASLLRMQARRAQHDETRQALHEAINRILSIAVVHEFLSQHEKTINARDVAGRIVQQVREGILGPGQDVRLCVEGDAVFLHAHQTTMVALVINELILNALEHGFGEQQAGEIVVSLADEGDRMALQVRDTGAGLPEGFTVDDSTSLGLRIVRTLVEQDMRGTFALKTVGPHTVASATFAKTPADDFGV